MLLIDACHRAWMSPLAPRAAGCDLCCWLRLCISPHPHTPTGCEGKKTKLFQLPFVRHATGRFMLCMVCKICCWCLQYIPKKMLSRGPVLKADKHGTKASVWGVGWGGLEHLGIAACAPALLRGSSYRHSPPPLPTPCCLQLHLSFLTMT